MEDICLAQMAIRSILERIRKEIVSDYVDHLGWWDWARLEDFLPASALLSILNHPPPALDLDQDSIIWKFTSSRQYTVKSVYKVCARTFFIEKDNAWRLIW